MFRSLDFFSMIIYNQCYVRRKLRKMPRPSCIPFAIVFAILIMCTIVIIPPIVTGVKVEMPQLNTQPIEIFDDFIYVTVYITDNERIIVNGSQVNSDEIVDAIKLIYKNASADEIKIFVRSDKNVNYNSIMSLLQLLNNGGFSDITLVGQYTGGIQNIH